MKRNQINIVNVLLTQRCNLRCEYCHITRNYPDMPESYKKVQKYSLEEIHPSIWISIFKKILKNNSKAFFILYGGEPFLYDDLKVILKWFNDNGVSYTVISNNSDSLKDKIIRTYHYAGKYRGFTSSVDPLIYSDEIDYESHRYKKSIDGFSKLCQLKETDFAEDVVAEITADKNNIHYLYKTVSDLSKDGIWSSITCIDDKKNNYYDFAAEVDSNLLLSSEDVDNQFDLIKKDNSLLVHIPKLLDELKNILPSNMKCEIYEDIHNITLSPDGRPRLCLRIRGVETPKVEEFIDGDGQVTNQFIEALAKDYFDYCLGCNWTCMLMSSMFGRNIINHS